MTAPEDRELEALLREQSLLPVPLGLLGRILDEVLPAEPLAPWALVGRAAAAVLAFCASWFAFSGEVPAFADVTAEAHVAAAVGSAAVPEALPEAVVPPALLAEAGERSAALWLLGGGLLLAGGLAWCWRTHARVARPGGDR